MTTIEIGRQATHDEIRKALGHGQGNRRVRISRDGRVTYFGSTNDTDRQHDFWHGGRWVEEYKIDEDGRAR